MKSISKDLMKEWDLDIYQGNDTETLASMKILVKIFELAPMPKNQALIEPDEDKNIVV